MVCDRCKTMVIPLYFLLITTCNSNYLKVDFIYLNTVFCARLPNTNTQVQAIADSISTIPILTKNITKNENNIKHT